MIKVSVIIPIYKVENYITDCICSVLNQTYRNLEVILVNDCTPDRSFEIAKRIIESSPSSNDLDFVYLCHFKNQGIACARNTGLKAVHGDYFFFLDSDDKITDNCIEILVSYVNKYPNVDIIQGNIVDTNNKKVKIYNEFNKYEYITDETIIKKTLFNDGSLPISIYNVVWNKLVRYDLVTKNEMWFKENMIAEDVYWLFMNWRFVKALCLINTPTYYYNDVPGSITNSEGQNIRAFYARMMIYHDFIPLIEKNDMWLYEKIIQQLHHCWKKNSYSHKKKELQVRYREVIKDLLNHDDLPIKVKCALWYLLLPNFVVRNEILKRMIL